MRRTQCLDDPSDLFILSVLGEKEGREKLTEATGVKAATLRRWEEGGDPSSAARAKLISVVEVFHQMLEVPTAAETAEWFYAAGADGKSPFDVLAADRYSCWSFRRLGELEFEAEGGITYEDEEEL